MRKLFIFLLCIICARARVSSNLNPTGEDEIKPVINVNTNNDDKPHNEKENFVKDGIAIAKVGENYIVAYRQSTSTTKPLIKIDLPVIDPPDNKTFAENESDIKSETEILNKELNKIVKKAKLKGNYTALTDGGDPLILTPLIKKGKISLARRLSKVDPTMFFGLASHSGFLTVEEKYDSNLFFWYFPVPNKPVNTTPWLIWLQGGPGASSMTGLLSEIGPIMTDDNSELKLNNETWGKEHSLLFIENPVGTGFSFTNSSLGYAHYTNASSIQLYQALQQFLQMFPELREAPLFITGESYAGKYIPGLAMEIHRNKNTEAPINLQGLTIGNGYVDPMSIANYSNVAYYFGLVEEEGRKQIALMEQDYIKFVNSGNSARAKEQWIDTVMLLHFMAAKDQVYNILQPKKLDFDQKGQFLHRADVRRAIHVGNLRYTFVNMTVNTEMAPDFIVNYRPVLEELLEHYRILMYNGHLDLMIPYVLTSENIRTWQWSGRDLFHRAERNPWLIGNVLAGFHKSGGNLTEVLVWNAGHTVPLDQPRSSRVMIEAFTSNKPLLGRSMSKAFFEYVRNYRHEQIYL